MENRHIKLIDEDDTLWEIEVQFPSENLNHISFVGHGDGAGGQIVDHILPATDAQRELIRLWNIYHLNGMSSGTSEQNEALKNCKYSKGYDYIEACEYLKSVGLYEVEHEGKPYKYGFGWIKETITDEIILQINECLDVLEDEYNERKKGPLVTEDGVEKVREWAYSDAERLVAFGILMELSMSELEDVKIDGTSFSYYKQGWVGGTENEVEELCDRVIKDYIEECVLPEIPEPYRDYFDTDGYAYDYLDDGRGRWLSSYDGYEKEISVNGTYYYFYRQ